MGNSSSRGSSRPTRGERFKRHARKIVAAGAIGVGLLGAYKGGKWAAANELRTIPKMRQAEITAMEGRVNAPPAVDLRRVLNGEELARVNEIVIGKIAAIDDARFNKEYKKRDSKLIRAYEKANPTGRSSIVFMWNASPEQVYSVLTPAEKSEWEGYVKKHQAQFRAFAQEYLADSPTEARNVANFSEKAGGTMAGMGSAVLFFLVTRAILRRRKLYPQWYE